MQCVAFFFNGIVWASDLYFISFFNLFLSYSFVKYRIDFLLSIWVNLHIYIDIIFVSLVFGLKFLLIIFLYCTWHIKHVYFFFFF